MPAVALGVEELRLRDPAGIYRTLYYKKSRRGILIVHAFVKKTPQTSKRELDLARRRLKEMLHEEKQVGHCA